MRNKLFILSIIAIVFFSCKKDDSSSTGTATTNTTILAEQSWKFNNAGLDPNKDGTIDVEVSDQIPACLKDNTVSFSSSGNGTVDEGTAKCNNADPQTVPFTWGFASNETLININGNAIAGKGGQYKVVALSSTQLSLSKDTTVALLGATTFVVNLKH
jgi:hypothetical protein